MPRIALWGPLSEVIVVILLAVVACDDAEFPTDGGGTVVGDSYTDVLEIFDGYCVSCHRGSAPVAGLDLETDPCGALVDVPSTRTDPYVAASDHEASVLWHRVADTGEYGTVMPPGNPMPQANIDTVAAWIDAGASCNGGGG